ncbi:hypothetical protein SLEP1_g1255 [Rubroshorea leprosula]|uniref:Uncharacterized protein n=1 Tax=Rubroshorea leprosula TaxID=152421 RepID=A0AAV5HJ10_9ROSI|nr:hypothetical protein SLEP1_g1255 [Rubroshorea leprosula]
MGDESWQSNIDNSEGVLVPSNVRKLKSPQPLKLLPASTDDSSRKHILDNREHRKVQLVEQPGQKTTVKNSQETRTATINQGHPMSADDIQKAKMHAQYMQSKYGKTGSSSNETNEVKIETLNKSSSTSTSISPLSLSHGLPKPEEPKRPLMLSTTTYNRMETLDQNQKMDSQETPLEKSKISNTMVTLDQNLKMDLQEPPSEKFRTYNRVETLDQIQKMDSQEASWEKYMKVQIPWQTPPENRNHREKETIYKTVQEIPCNPKEPWDREMDYNDTLTPEIPTEQPPDIDGTETQVAHEEHVNGEAGSQASSSLSFIGGKIAAEPELELLAVLLKNPELVFALTSGNAANLTSQETVKLLDVIKSGGAGFIANSNGFGNKVAEKVEVSLPSPTPSCNPGTMKNEKVLAKENKRSGCLGFPASVLHTSVEKLAFTRTPALAV